MSSRLLAALLALARPCAAAAAPSTFALQPQPGKAALGTPVEIRGTASYPDRFALSIDLAAQTTGPFALLDAQLGAAEAAGGKKSQQVRLRVVPFDVGTVTLPALSWTLKDSSGAVETLKSPPVKLEVEAPAGAGGTGDIRDIKGPLKAPAWPFVLMALLAAAAAAGAYWKLRRRQAPGQAAPVFVDARPPHEIALAELEALWGQELPLKEFYVRACDILRLYLERRFGIPASVLTTGDLIRQMRQAELDRNAVTRAKELFERCDLVKFAKLAPDEPQRRSDWSMAAEIVRATQPAPLGSPETSNVKP